MHKRIAATIVVAACAAAAMASSEKAKQPVAIQFDRARVTLGHTKDVLPNGLTLLVHEDHTIPVVAVHLWYNVGSRNETAGKTGLAHLFEHLFSDGSEHHPRGFREAMNEVGATNLNGFTDMDRTLFFEDVPVSALERTLYLEADRMGFLEKQITKESLDRQRAIVENEKRQGESQPYGRNPSHIAASIYPPSHPYSRTTMGSTGDLAALSLDDAREWYRQYYAPNNCVLSLAGAITRPRALELATRYFADIPAGPPLQRTKDLVPAFNEHVRAEAQERVPQARVYRVYHGPGWRSRDIPVLKLIANLLSGSNSALLDRRLVSEKELVTNVRARVDVRELASQISIVATLKEGVEPEAVEREIEATVSAFQRAGPTQDELRRAKMRELAAFIRENERLGARAGLLAESMTFGGNPDAYLDRLEAQAVATPEEVVKVASRWLGAKHYTLIVKPHPPLRPSKPAVDRTVLPAIGPEPADIGFPPVATATLSNGLKVVLAERHGTPVVRCALVVDAGYASDPLDKRGTASLAMTLLTKGGSSPHPFALADALDAVGARMSAWNTLDVSVAALESSSSSVADALDLFARIAIRPAFPEATLQSSRQQRLAEIAQEKADPNRTGMTFVRRLIYGDAHPYAVPLSGFGTEQTLSRITRDDIVAWHGTWFRPDNSTLVITGDVTLPEITPHLERAFGRWRVAASPQKKNMATPQRQLPKVYLIDDPGAAQTVIVGAHISEAGGRPDDAAITAVVRGLGGMVTSRLNRNLRVEKQWSYNSWAALLPSRGERTFLVFAPVRTDKTKESLMEIRRELAAITGEKPIAGDEFRSIMRNEILSLPGRFATMSAVENALVETIVHGYPADHFARYAERLRTLSEADLAAAAKTYIRPDDMIWIIRGDGKTLEASIREAGVGDVQRVDTAGQPVHEARPAKP
ncbi:MAG TPA: pitrilysin family protein [Thermoanaerobaculia bacterium]|nr:pitrilysin family protein [Thermoanaerobaculia bacterium]